MRSLLIPLKEVGLEQSLKMAEAFRPMLAEMESFLTRQAKPQFAHLNDNFAERQIVLSRQFGSAVRTELSLSASLSVFTSPPNS